MGLCWNDLPLKQVARGGKTGEQVCCEEAMLRSADVKSNKKNGFFQKTFLPVKIIL